MNQDQTKKLQDMISKKNKNKNKNCIDIIILLATINYLKTQFPIKLDRTSSKSSKT
jgi:chorismate mutase